MIGPLYITTNHKSDIQIKYLISISTSNRVTSISCDFFSIYFKNIFFTAIDHPFLLKWFENVTVHFVQSDVLTISFDIIWIERSLWQNWSVLIIPLRHINQKTEDRLLTDVDAGLTSDCRQHMMTVIRPPGGCVILDNLWWQSDIWWSTIYDDNRTSASRTSDGRQHMMTIGRPMVDNIWWQSDVRWSDVRVSTTYDDNRTSDCRPKGLTVLNHFSTVRY